MKHWMRLSGLLLALALCLPMLMISVSADSGSLEGLKPTKEEISRKWGQVTEAEELYVDEPSAKVPYRTGKLSDSFLESGLTYLNFIRFVANLPEVQLSDSISENAQYGAVVLAANDELTHYPDQPADMDDLFYQKGYEATSSSNISYSSAGVDATSIQSSLQGCMRDSSSYSNLSSVGHRRWLLNPTLLNVGFGCAESESGASYVTTKVFDQSGPAVNYNYISWPASGNFPANLFSADVPWSITLNPRKYQTPSADKIRITVTRESDGKQWYFDRASVAAQPGDQAYMTVQTSYYGINNCIIFRPEMGSIENYSGVFSVSLKGIRRSDGTQTELSFKVDFFDMVGGDVEYDATGVTGSCGDNLRWRFDSPTGTLTVFGTGDMTGAPWGDLAEKTTRVVIEEGATSIADHAFESYYWLESVSLPSTVERIGEFAFSECSFTDIELPENLKRIETGAFKWTDLKSVTIPSQVAYIGGKAFEYCWNLEEVWFTGDAPEFGSDVFYGVTGYYPEDNETWDIGSIDSGNVGWITWKSYMPVHIMDEGTVTRQPADGQDGEKIYVCSHCGYTVKETIHNYVPVTVDPTCTEQGYTGKACTNCDDRQVDTYSDPTGHSFGKWKQQKAPSCAAVGVEIRSCGFCDKTEQRSIAVLGHHYETVVTEPTCTEMGAVMQVCSACGDSYVETYTYPHGHFYVNGACAFCGDSLALVEAPRVKVSNVAKSGKIKLSWNKVSGAVSYQIYRSTSKNSGYQLLSTVKGTSVTNSRNTVAGKTYYYYVVAVDENGYTSEKSNTVARTCDLAQPQVKLSNVSKSGKIKVSWEKVEGAVKYEVYRATSKNGKYTKLITTKNTSINNTSTTAGKTYYYKVRAIASKSAANSAYSDIKSRTCDLARPDAEVERNKKGKPVVSWEKVSGARSYKVYIYDVNGKQIKTVTTSKLSMTHSSAVKNRTYSYRVVALHSSSSANSAKSSSVKIKSR